jgi:hypothetical protein
MDAIDHSRSALPRNSELNWALVLLATGASAFNGVLGWLSVLIFSGQESYVTQMSIYVPLFLWPGAISCLKWPRIGLLFYLSLLGLAIMLCANPLHHGFRWNSLLHCTDNLRFAAFGAALLLLNALVRTLRERFE